MMNFLLASDKRRPQQNGSMYSCRYCDKVFTSSQARGGHLKAHKNMMQKYQIYRSPYDSIDGKLYENDTKLIMPSNLSYATSSNAFSRALAPSGGLMPSAFSLGHPMHMGSKNPLGLTSYGSSIGISHFNADSLQSVIYDFPYLSDIFLHTMKYLNCSNHPYSSCVMCSFCPPHLMNNLSKFKDFISKFLAKRHPFVAGLFPPPQTQCSGSICPDDSIRGLTSRRPRKHCLCEAAAIAVMIRAAKRPRVSSSSGVRWERKPPYNELRLFKDSKNSFSASGTTISGEDIDKANLDLSLHL